MHLTIGSVVSITVNLLLAAYFFYTFVAIFKGAAPVPSRRSTVRSMMSLARIKAGEVLYDLGSGDGRVLFAAQALGARTIGYEINPFLYWYTRLRIALKQTAHVTVKRENFWDAPLRDANVVTVYLVPHLMERLKKKLQEETQPGTRVISAVYPFPDWEPLEQDGSVFLYIV
ncbi:MAG: class I SAM-dependent methyltransferase [Bdellovibrionota bacterium]